MFDTTQKAYISLRDIVAERTQRLILWTGAGLSKPAGMPDWLELRRKVCVAMRDKYERLEDSPGKNSKIGSISFAEANEDLWLAFQILHDLSETTYRETIRDAFKEAPRCQIPEVYTKLWKLPVNGIMTLNLDRLVTRAYTASAAGMAPREFTGKTAANFIHLLNSPYPFIGNLHGKEEDYSSWVMGKDQLRDIFEEPGYKQMIDAVLALSPVVFLGITVPDIAVGSHLDRLASLGLDCGTHYWITDNKDLATHNWAEKVGLRIIVYENNNNDHTELLHLLDDLLTYVAQEPGTFEPNVVDRQQMDGTLESPEELAHLSPEIIRQKLNEHARKLLSDKTENGYNNFEEFRTKYGRAIYNSWYVSTTPPNNIILDYTLKKEIAEGSFGRIFEAVDAEGNKRAIKLLKEEVGRKPEMLQSFRRGVNSMKILASNNIDGMVPYIESSEIPAFIAMDFVDGPNLKKSVEANFISDFRDIIRVSRDIAHILHEAHRLPERVLHRDLRPPNIMLKGYYEDNINYDVVVLDFDLSWHQGAIEESIVASSLNGFLAPEQVENIHSASTRNALVDSFGLGMLMLYMASRKEPSHLQHRYAKWKEFLEDNVGSKLFNSWISLPRRFARLIEICTRDKQSERWDMSQITAELDRLLVAANNRVGSISSELLAEELAARTMSKISDSHAYYWDSNKLQAVLNTTGGGIATIRTNESSGSVDVNIEWGKNLSQDSKQVKKWLPCAKQSAEDCMKRGKWTTKQSFVRHEKSLNGEYTAHTKRISFFSCLAN